jgi:hypothetical protein
MSFLPVPLLKKLFSRISSLPVLLRRVFRVKVSSDPEKSGEEAPKPELSAEDLLFEAPSEDLTESRESAQNGLSEDPFAKKSSKEVSEEEKPFRDEKKRGFSSRGLFRLVFLLLSLLAILLAGVLFWKIFLNLFQEPSGPSLRNISRKEESLYSPLGFPLTGVALLRELPGLGISLESLEREGEGRYQGASEALEILVASQDGRVVPLFLGVQEKWVSLKWGLRVGISEEQLLSFLGPPAERSGDLRIYRDRWDNEIVYRISHDRIARVEYYYPQGLLLEE